ncbi:MAG: SURF1 family protein [Pseudomonadota bacterium]|nr:SURF1 family protein [Pseudomonadota bacterium]
MTACDSTPKRRTWRPSPFGAALTVVGTALLMQLGFWQLGRAEQKQALLDQYARNQQTLVDITPANAAALSRYQRGRVTGRYDSSHQILLDNMPSHTGQPGYRVLTPFDTPAGWLLVDRGWVPMGSTRNELPDIAVGDSQRMITGTIDDLPRAGLELELPPVAADVPWPRLLSFPKQAVLERQLGRKLISGLLLLDASQPDGYERIWEAHLGFMPERHIGYAVQWFALAAAAVIIFIITSFRTKKATDATNR